MPAPTGLGLVTFGQLYGPFFPEATSATPQPTTETRVLGGRAQYAVTPGTGNKGRTGLEP